MLLSNAPWMYARTCGSRASLQLSLVEIQAFEPGRNWL